MIKKRFGLIKRYYCDRCGKKIDYDVFCLCENCYAIDPMGIRHFQIVKEKSRDTVNMKCCLCRINLTENKSYQVCLNCVSEHPDNSHNDWTYRIPHTSGLTWANHCFHCGSVQIVSRNRDLSLDFSYFQKGNNYPQRKSFICPQHDLDTLHEENKNCVHDWKVVAENINKIETARDTYNELKSNPVRDWMGWNDAELLHIAYGERSNWCWKCGCFYITSPGTNRPLPQKGVWDEN